MATQEPELLSFLAGVCLAPGPDLVAALGVFADWLEERGHEHAALARGRYAAAIWVDRLHAGYTPKSVRAPEDMRREIVEAAVKPFGVERMDGGWYLYEARQAMAVATHWLAGDGWHEIPF
jgi:hypothetical protein